MKRHWRILLAAALLSSSAVAAAAAFPALLRIPPLDPAAARTLPQASFSHRSHQAWGCFTCHPAIFPQAPQAFAHVDMRQGRYCGHCHQGKTASAIEGLPCAGCHASTR